ncbi:unnamed protein product [Vitrella brassicaformis CCMP3155]|uniref:Rab-GAP TBC domain-containing protein n=3 Tax=Vitrella brassicaformis TaxID=1169539 RepID=A0A0G4FE80_VITBC|nr:unnamed protein product [Vitrella brassicaformis CCMP3155]|eukprot:CEM11165.1 unnamed protein product [Vitrella brassicaformis CCMP3155]
MRGYGRARPFFPPPGSQEDTAESSEMDAQQHTQPAVPPRSLPPAPGRVTGWNPPPRVDAAQPGPSPVSMRQSLSMCEGGSDNHLNELIRTKLAVAGMQEQKLRQEKDMQEMSSDIVKLANEKVSLAQELEDAREQNERWGDAYRRVLHEKKINEEVFLDEIQTLRAQIASMEPAATPTSSRHRVESGDADKDGGVSRSSSVEGTRAHDTQRKVSGAKDKSYLSFGALYKGGRGYGFFGAGADDGDSGTILDAGESVVDDTDELLALTGRKYRKDHHLHLMPTMPAPPPPPPAPKPPETDSPLIAIPPGDTAAPAAPQSPSPPPASDGPAAAAEGERQDEGAMSSVWTSAMTAMGMPASDIGRAMMQGHSWKSFFKGGGKNRPRTMGPMEEVDVWVEKILPEFDAYRHENPKLFASLIRKGLPQEIRGEVWKKCIGNKLQITPTLYRILLGRVEKVRDFMMKVSKRYRDKINETVNAASRQQQQEEDRSEETEAAAEAAGASREDEIVPDPSATAVGSQTGGVRPDHSCVFYESEILSSFEMIGMDLNRTLPRLGVFRKQSQTDTDAAEAAGSTPTPEPPDDQGAGDGSMTITVQQDESDSASPSSLSPSDDPSPHSAASPAASSQSREQQGARGRRGRMRNRGVARVGEHGVEMTEMDTRGDEERDKVRPPERAKRVGVAYGDPGHPGVQPLPFAVPHDGVLHEHLRTVLETYVLWRPDLGYVQGMAYLAAMLLLHMDEYSAFVCFANLMLRRSLHAFYTFDMSIVDVYFRTFDHLMKERLPWVAMKLHQCGLNSDMFLVEWLYTLFTRSLPFALVARVWDSFLAEGDTILYQTALGLLCYFSDALEKGSHDQCMELLSSSSARHYQEIDLVRFQECVASLKITRQKVEDAMRHVKRELEKPKTHSQTHPPTPDPPEGHPSLDAQPMASPSSDKGPADAIPVSIPKPDSAPSTHHNVRTPPQTGRIAANLVKETDPHPQAYRVSVAHKPSSGSGKDKRGGGMGILGGGGKGGGGGGLGVSSFNPFKMKIKKKSKHESSDDRHQVPPPDARTIMPMMRREPDAQEDTEVSTMAGNVVQQPQSGEEMANVATDDLESRELEGGGSGAGGGSPEASLEEAPDSLTAPDIHSGPVDEK